MEKIIVVGGGAAGMMAAMAAADRGKQVLLLEKNDFHYREGTLQCD